MNQSKGLFTLFKATFPSAVLAIGMIFVNAASATNLNLNLVSTAITPPGTFNGLGRDPVTGEYFSANSYQSTSLQRFATLSDFLNNANAVNTTLADNHFGTYHVMQNDKLFARTTNPTGTTLGRFDAVTGALEYSASFPGYDGGNGTATFDWGGYSGLNLFSDASGMWMLSRNLLGDWHILKLDNNFNVLTDYTYGNTTLGYAFVVNGNMFLGSTFVNPTFTSKVDLATGGQSAVNFTFTGMTGFLYLSQMFYDSAGDMLYVSDEGSIPGSPGVFALSNAAAQLGVVPEPGSMVLLGFGGVLFLRRRKSLAP